jgi:hypothetical protein
MRCCNMQTMSSGVITVRTCPIIPILTYLTWHRNTGLSPGAAKSFRALHTLLPINLIFFYTVIIRVCLCVENPFHNKIGNCWYFKSASVAGKGISASVFGGKFSVLLLKNQNIKLFKTSYRTFRQIWRMPPLVFHLAALTNVSKYTFLFHMHQWLWNVIRDCYR